MVMRLGMIVALAAAVAVGGCCCDKCGCGKSGDIGKVGADGFTWYTSDDIGRAGE